MSEGGLKAERIGPHATEVVKVMDTEDKKGSEEKGDTAGESEYEVKTIKVYRRRVKGEEA